MGNTQPDLPGRQLNVVALLAFVVGAALAGLDLWIVEISSSPDSPVIGLLLGLLPSLTAILWVYPTVSWFYSRGVTWRSELGDARAGIAQMQEEVAQMHEEIRKLRQDLGGS